MLTLTFGADLGGLMVYKFGAGVQAVPVAEGHDHSAHGRDGRGMEETEAHETEAPAVNKAATAQDEAAAAPHGAHGDGGPKAGGKESEVKDRHHDDGDVAPHSH